MPSACRLGDPQEERDRRTIHLTVAGFFDSAKMMAGGNPEEMTIEDAK
jgi:hypothetical protein